MSQRPCEGGIDFEHVYGNTENLELTDGSIVTVPINDPGEVWLVAAREDGGMFDDSQSCYEFYTEGHWASALVTGEDYNDYLFDSLRVVSPRSPIHTF